MFDAFFIRHNLHRKFICMLFCSGTPFNNFTKIWKDKKTIFNFNIILQLKYIWIMRCEYYKWKFPLINWWNCTFILHKYCYKCKNFTLFLNKTRLWKIVLRTKGNRNKNIAFSFKTIDTLLYVHQLFQIKNINTRTN